MQNLNEDFKVLNELIRTAYKLISPISYQDDLKRLTPEFLKRDSVKSPGCYLAIGDGNNNNTIFPICNRYGYKDPEMIKFSLKLAKRMSDSDHCHKHLLPGTVVKLQRMLAKYDKPVPNTVSGAVLKARATRTFNNKTFRDNKEFTQEWVDGAVGGVYLVTALYNMLRPLVIQIARENDEEKKAALQQKADVIKQKIAKAKQAQA